MSESDQVRATWAEAIRLERARKRLNQADVARLAEVDQTTVSKAEAGRGSLEMFLAIGKALGLDLVRELVGES